MENLQSLQEFEMGIALFLVPLFVGIFLLVFGRSILYISECIMNGFMFRLRGFKVYNQILINGKPALITRIGLMSTHMMLLTESKEHMKFITFSNDRLKIQEIIRVVHHNFDISLG